MHLSKTNLNWAITILFNENPKTHLAEKSFRISHILDIPILAVEKMRCSIQLHIFLMCVTSVISEPICSWTVQNDKWSSMHSKKGMRIRRRALSTKCFIHNNEINSGMFLSLNLMSVRFFGFKSVLSKGPLWRRDGLGTETRDQVFFKKGILSWQLEKRVFWAEKLPKLLNI